MKQLFPCMAVFFAFNFYTHAVILVDDTWADGSRTNLPFSSDNSVWYSSSISAGTNLFAVTNTMTFWTAPTSARMILTYFTPTNTTQSLQVGETLKLALTFTPSGVNTQNSSSVRIALVNYGGTNRVGADGFSASGGNGAGVAGYAFNVNFGQTFGATRPIDIRQRTNVNSGDLLGTANVYERLTNGPVVTTGTPGFSNGVPYTAEFLVSRTNANTVVITASFTGAGLAITNTAVDAFDPTLSFDAFALRVGDETTSATFFNFSRYKVELISAVLVAPSITGITRIGNDVALAFTGSVADGYRLWTTTNLALAPVTSTWTQLTNGSFLGGVESFTHTNGATGLQQFYILSSP